MVYCIIFYKHIHFKILWMIHSTCYVVSIFHLFFSKDPLLKHDFQITYPCICCFKLSIFVLRLHSKSSPILNRKWTEKVTIWSSIAWVGNIFENHFSTTVYTTLIVYLVCYACNWLERSNYYILCRVCWFCVVFLLLCAIYFIRYFKSKNSFFLKSYIAHSLSFHQLSLKPVYINNRKISDQLLYFHWQMLWNW
jgi:hypothetical protein